MIDVKNDNLFINKEVNEHLKIILQRKVFSNGYIFYGPEGIGKKQTAIQFIKEIFNQYSSNTNIGEKIINNNHPDFLLIEPTYFLKGNLMNRSKTDSSKNTKETIRVEQIRQIKTFLAQKSIDSGKKIVLIVDADLLNEAASNCLLKTLEEPTNGLFILLTSRLSSLLDTIISRCQLIRFKSFSNKELEIFIKNNLDSSILNIEEESYENDRPENEFNTTIMVEVLEKLMSNPYEIKLEKPEFNFDPNNKKEFQVALNVNYKLKAQLIKDMLKSLPYSGLKQDGSLTVFYFNKDKYNFPMNITERIQLGKHRTVPVIQLRDRNDNPLVILVDSPEKEIHNLNSKKIIYKPFHSFSPLIDFSVGGWSMQVALETVDIQAVYEFILPVSEIESLSNVSLKFVNENDLKSFLEPIL